MTVFTSSGTSLAISASAPATYNEAGYEALTFTQIGEVGDLGDLPSAVHEIVVWRNITNRGPSKAKGPYDFPDQTVMLGFDPDDTGQALLDAAILSDATYSVRVSSPGMGDFYRRVLITGGPINFGDGSATATRQVTLATTIVSESETGVVYVPPA